MQLSVTSCQPHKLQDKLSTTTAGRTILAKFGRCTYLPMGEIPWVAATLHSQTRWKQLTPLPADALEIRLLPFYLWEQRRMMCLTCSLLIFLTVCNRPFNRMLLAILGVCLYHLFNFSKERLGSSPPPVENSNYIVGCPGRHLRFEDNRCFCFCVRKFVQEVSESVNNE